MKNIALIPARGGSKGVLRKNIKLFNSKPLIYWTIKTALESKYIDRVIVSTEDDEIADISKSFSAEVPFKRPYELAEDDTKAIDVVLHALNNLTNVDNILLLQPTSPLRKTIHINQIFELRSKYNSASAVSITSSRKNIDLYFDLDSKNRISPYSKDLRLLPRQHYPKTYVLNGALYLSTSDSILKNKSFILSSTIGYVMAEEYSIDIDTQFDWDMAEFLMSKSL